MGLVILTKFVEYEVVGWLLLNVDTKLHWSHQSPRYLYDIFFDLNIKQGRLQRNKSLPEIFLFMSPETQYLIHEPRRTEENLNVSQGGWESCLGPWP